MKLKKFVKHLNDYVEVEIYENISGKLYDQKLYTGNVYNIPERLLNYKMDSYAGATVEVKYDDNNEQYLAMIIPVLKNC